MDCLCNISWKLHWNVVFPSMEMLLRLFQKPLLERSRGRAAANAMLPLAQPWWESWHGPGTALWWAQPSQNQPHQGMEGNKPACGNAGEKGRFSFEEGVIMSCAATAIYEMNGCQQPGWCVPRYAFQHCWETADGPSWGGLSVSFQHSIPPFGPKTSFGVWSGWDSPGQVVLSHLGARSPSCSSMCCIHVNHGRLT